MLDTSAPHVAGYTSRSRSILEAQTPLGMHATALTGPRQIGGARDHDDIGGVRYHRTPGYEALARVPLARELGEMAATARRIDALCAAASPGFDVVHAHSPVLCGIPAHAVARRRGLASVYEVRALWEDAAVDQERTRAGSARYRAIRAAETWLARAVDAVVVICDGLRRELVARGVPDARVFTVPNGVDPQRFPPPPRDDALAARLGLGGKIVVAYIGTLFRFEGVDLLLEALRELTSRDDRVRGLIVGHGETEEALRRRHAELGLGDRVVITGKVAPSEVARYYSVADVLCYPRESRRITELTTPLKPLEALCMEKAVLGSDVGGIRELVKDGATGLLFRAGDVVDLARQLERLVGDPAIRRRLGEAGRRDMLANRDWSLVARRYRAVYASALERSAARRSTRPPASAAPRPSGPPSAPRA